MAINAQTGTTYTVIAGDIGKLITCNNASAITVTIPTGLGAGFHASVQQMGAGAVTVAAGAGMTRRNRQGHTKTAGQYATVAIIMTTATEFLLQGDTAA
jgi:hypothetical protein